MVNAKRIRYGSEIISPTCSKGKFQSRCFKRMPNFEEDNKTKRTIFGCMHIKKQDEFHVLIGK
jgi:hypothetical protein